VGVRAQTRCSRELLSLPRHQVTASPRSRSVPNSQHADQCCLALSRWPRASCSTQLSCLWSASTQATAPPPRTGSAHYLLGGVWPIGSRALVHHREYLPSSASLGDRCGCDVLFTPVHRSIGGWAISFVRRKRPCTSSICMCSRPFCASLPTRTS